MKKNLNALSIILALSLAAKLAVWARILATGTYLFTWSDTVGYHNSAVVLHRLGTFSLCMQRPETPQTLRTPGYPAFLAGIYALFGEGWSAVMVVQIIISLITIALVYYLARHFWNSRAAAIAALLLALDAVSFTYTLKVMTENLFTLFIVLMVFSGVFFLQGKRRPLWAFALGLSLALATLTRPMSYYLLLPVVFGFLIYAMVQKWTRRVIFLNLLLMIIPSIVLIGGWQWRNYKETGSSVYTSIEGFYTYYWQAASVLAAEEGISIEQEQVKLGLGNDRGLPYQRGVGYREQHPDARDLSFAQLSERWQKEGKEIIRQHPWTFARIYFAGILRMLARPGYNDFLEIIGAPASDFSLRHMLRHPVMLAIVSFTAVYLIILYLGLLRYLWSSLRRVKVNFAHLYVWGIILYIILVSGGPTAFSRFRLPLMPLFALYAAKAISDSWRRPASAEDSRASQATANVPSGVPYHNNVTC